MNKRYTKVWDKIAEKYAKDSITGKIDSEHKQIFKEWLTKGTVLDVGCANGKHLLYLAKNGFIPTGLDISSKMIEQAKNILRKNGVKANLFVGSATDIPFPDNSFDNVICMGNSVGSIPGQENRVHAINEILRVAKHNIVFELLKSDTNEEVFAKYWFSGDDERFPVKRWGEEEISNVISGVADKMGLHIEFKIKKGRKSLLEKYLFYLLIKKVKTKGAV